MAETIPKIEDVEDAVSSEEEVPALEATAPVEGETSTPKSKQSRSEKKSRKVVQKLGLKQVPGVMRVNVRRGKSVLFVLNTPDVYKNSNDSTFVVFGEAKMEQDVANNALTQNFGDFESVPELVADAAETPVEEGETDASAEHIQLVIDQTSCTRAQAIAALEETKGDVVNAIMKLTV